MASSFDDLARRLVPAAIFEPKSYVFALVLELVLVLVLVLFCVGRLLSLSVSSLFSYVSYCSSLSSPSYVYHVFVYYFGEWRCHCKTNPPHVLALARRHCLLLQALKLAHALSI